MQQKKSTSPVDLPVDHAQDIANALGLPIAATYLGKEWQLEPLSIFDVGSLIARAGTMDLEAIESNPDAVAFMAYLVLRKSDPDLTPEQRANRRYRMTPADVESLFSIHHAGQEQLDFLQAIKNASGLVAPYTDEPELDPKNAPAATVPTTRRRQRNTRGDASSSSSASAAV